MLFCYKTGNYHIRALSLKLNYLNNKKKCNLKHDVPPGKHALIIVRQPKGNLIWIASEASTAKKNEKEKFIPTINTWDECDNVQVMTILFFFISLRCLFEWRIVFLFFQENLYFLSVCFIFQHLYKREN